ncbi:hypothetical protein LINPERPRIM_LOCUS312 [Linum perenne]
MKVLGSVISVEETRVELVCTLMEAMVVATVAKKALACLLFLVGPLLAESNALPNLTIVEERFPFSKLNEKTRLDVENKDVSNTEDDDDVDDDDDDVGDEEFS